ncbi:MAG: hypothetical protein ACMG6E_04595, partial [Candidatus Roizmanbacteria bacterium]
AKNLNYKIVEPNANTANNEEKASDDIFQDSTVITVFDTIPDIWNSFYVQKQIAIGAKKLMQRRKNQRAIKRRKRNNEKDEEVTRSIND